MPASPRPEPGGSWARWSRCAWLLACELVAAVRAIRMRGIVPPGGELREFYACGGPPASGDR